jgi:hypothetical protein
MVAELKETCAATPDGKVLILHVRGSAKPNVDICSELMELLPEAYYPDDAASVQYVIALHATFDTTGRTYSSGSKQIVENTAVTVYNAVTGKKLYTATQKGPTSLTMSYSGKAPTYYSAGAPEISALVKTAAEKITKDMGK